MTADRGVLSMYKVAIILPSRGLIFSRTADEILQNVKGIPHKFFFSHRRPLPECFEEPTLRALEDKDITHLWLAEDDLILPRKILQDMLDKDVAVCTVDYPTTKKGDHAVLIIKNQVIYGGTGCTLVKREVFNELKPPYFRDDIVWSPKRYTDQIKFVGKNKGKDDDSYGLHDVHFFMRLNMRGIPIHTLDYTVGQRKLVELGKAGTNNGAHNIETWTKLKKSDYWKESEKWAEKRPDGLIEVKTETGNINVRPDHAEKLIKQGKAERLPAKIVMFDGNEIL
jgi:hypothetical protein